MESWLEANRNRINLLKKAYIDYTYEEKASGFKSVFQMAMFVLQTHSS